MSWKALSRHLSEQFRARSGELKQLSGFLKLYQLLLPGQPYLMEFLEVLLSSSELLEGSPVSAREVHIRLERLENSMSVQEEDFQRIKELLETLLKSLDERSEAQLSTLSELDELDDSTLDDLSIERLASLSGEQLSENSTSYQLFLEGLNFEYEAQLSIDQLKSALKGRDPEGLYPEIAELVTELRRLITYGLYLVVTSETQTLKENLQSATDYQRFSTSLFKALQCDLLGAGAPIHDPEQYIAREREASLTINRRAPTERLAFATPLEGLEWLSSLCLTLAQSYDLTQLEPRHVLSEGVKIIAFTAWQSDTLFMEQLEATLKQLMKLRRGARLEANGLLKGRFRVVDLPVKVGGMCQVYQVQELQDDEQGALYALKVLKPSPMEGQARLDEHQVRFLREWQLLKDVRDKDIGGRFVAAYELISISPHIKAMRLEWIEGWTLEHLLSHFESISLAELLTLWLRLVESVSLLHQRGVMHRDLSLRNVMIPQRFDKPSYQEPKLIDFGLSTSEDLTKITREGGVGGTYWFIPPDNPPDNVSDGYQRDSYSLGVLLYYLVHREFPSEKELSEEHKQEQGLRPYMRDQYLRLMRTQPEGLRARVSAALYPILHHSLNPEAADRATLTQLLEALKTRWLDHTFLVIDPGALPHEEGWFDNPPLLASWARHSSRAALDVEELTLRQDMSDQARPRSYLLAMYTSALFGEGHHGAHIQLLKDRHKALARVLARPHRVSGIELKVRGERRSYVYAVYDRLPRAATLFRQGESEWLSSGALAEFCFSVLDILQVLFEGGEVIKGGLMEQLWLLPQGLEEGDLVSRLALPKALLGTRGCSASELKRWRQETLEQLIQMKERLSLEQESPAYKALHKLLSALKEGKRAWPLPEDELVKRRYILDTSTNSLSGDAPSDAQETLEERHNASPQPISEGGFGKVYRGLDLSNSEVVIVKRPLEERGDDDVYQVFNSFKKEVELLRRVHSPYVSRLIDSGVMRGSRVPYLVMEHLDAKTLHQWVAQVGEVRLVDVIEVTQQVLYGVEALHSLKIYHRDLNSNNIMVRDERPRSGELRACIIDLGVASGLNNPKTNPLYSNPSHFILKGRNILHDPPKGYYTTRAEYARWDLFSVGMTFLQVYPKLLNRATSAEPFNKANPHDLALLWVMRLIDWRAFEREGRLDHRFACWLRLTPLASKSLPEEHQPALRALREGLSAVFRGYELAPFLSAQEAIVNLNKVKGFLLSYPQQQLKQVRRALDQTRAQLDERTVKLQETSSALTSKQRDLEESQASLARHQTQAELERAQLASQHEKLIEEERARHQQELKVNERELKRAQKSEQHAKKIVEKLERKLKSSKSGGLFGLWGGGKANSVNQANEDVQEIEPEKTSESAHSTDQRSEDAVDHSTMDHGVTTQAVGEVVFRERVIPAPLGGKPFLMMETQVTQALYEAVMGTNPSCFHEGGAQRPVENVSWEDGVKFANALSRKLGLTPAYEGSDNNARFNEGANGFRLPFEAEWEFAAQGGQDFKYAGSDNLSEVGWYGGWDGSGNVPKHKRGTRDVARLKPNGYGLYDMSGNVWEWCVDDYFNPGQYRPGAARRVLRGGGWRGSADGCAVTRRCRNAPDDRLYDLGLRLSRSIDPLDP